MGLVESIIVSVGVGVFVDVVVRVELGVFVHVGLVVEVEVDVIVFVIVVVGAVINEGSASGVEVFEITNFGVNVKVEKVVSLDNMVAVGILFPII